MTARANPDYSRPGIRLRSPCAVLPAGATWGGGISSPAAPSLGVRRV